MATAKAALTEPNSRHLDRSAFFQSLFPHRPTPACPPARPPGTYQGPLAPGRRQAAAASAMPAARSGTGVVICGQHQLYSLWILDPAARVIRLVGRFTGGGFGSIPIVIVAVTWHHHHRRISSPRARPSGPARASPSHIASSSRIVAHRPHRHRTWHRSSIIHHRHRTGVTTTGPGHHIIIAHRRTRIITCHHLSAHRSRPIIIILHPSYRHHHRPSHHHHRIAPSHHRVVIIITIARQSSHHHRHSSSATTKTPSQSNRHRHIVIASGSSSPAHRIAHRPAARAHHRTHRGRLVVTRRP